MLSHEDLSTKGPEKAISLDLRTFLIISSIDRRKCCCYVEWVGRGVDWLGSAFRAHTKSRKHPNKDLKHLGLPHLPSFAGPSEPQQLWPQTSPQQEIMATEAVLLLIQFQTKFLENLGLMQV